MVVHPGVRRLVRAASERWPDDPFVERFVERYFAELPEFDIDERREDDLVAAAVAHLALGRRRRSGETSLAVEPIGAAGDDGSRRTAVMIVTDDAPFLVDTARLVLERHDIVTHLLVHPMLVVRRDADGVLQDVDADTEVAAAGHVEAWTFIEIDHLPEDRVEAVRSELVAAVHSVHRVVADFGAMRDRLGRHRTRDPLLGWLADGNFVFLGAASYRIGASGPVLLEGIGHPATFETIDPPMVVDRTDVSLGRAAGTSTIHRAARYTVVSVVDLVDGVVHVERFIGLLAVTAYRQSVLAIPTVGDRARAVLDLAARGVETHVGRTMRNVLESLPRDLVFELDTDRLARLVIDVVGLHERQIVRVFDVPEPVGDSSTVLVFLPRQRFDAHLPAAVGAHVAERYGGSVRDLESHVGASSLARITMTVRRPPTPPDLDGLSDELDEMTTPWIDRVHAALGERFSDDDVDRLTRRVASGAPDSYRNSVDPKTAVVDLHQLSELVPVGSGTAGDATAASLVREVGPVDGVWRMRVYRRGAPLTLSGLLPLLGLLGFEALDERPHRFVVDGIVCHLYDIGVRLPPGIVLDDARSREVLATFSGVLGGDLDADGFHRLVASAGLTIRQVEVIRTYARYARQIGFAFSQGYVEDTFAAVPELASELVALFEGRFDPDLDAGDRVAAVAHAEARILAVLDAVPSIDHDRIGRMFLALVRATVRTSAYRDRSTIALKFDPALVPDLPAPRPAHEIFVSSPRVEGVHLRGGAIARGGLRWSDRPEDYRTEVLGLVKAQMVKNAVIVPVGAKGGFVLKRPPTDPSARRAEAEECYREFVSGLLDVTDDVAGGAVVPPPRTVRYDDDDPYLVVAADKGTATFSDLANAVAAEYGFWLGDAFASGGSVGYDHKAMGITARGAWESARRHARMIGKSADRDVLTVVGVGDMSGDVFGNGMLLSSHLALVAAFDHRHVFVDPAPDPARSFAERRRLFDLPRSSWADYDPDVLSPGAVVVSRSVKSIDLSPEVRAVLDVAAVRLSPNELIAAILRAPVDMLWNGGIGTYVKASSEANADVGDRANDPVRIDGRDLRCRMVVEGGNLGMTQLGRVEYALAGGLVHTDAIDNSAGVDCSDHEVNIKILLAAAVESGDLAAADRAGLLAGMADEVAALVLANNRAQTLALQIARYQGLHMVSAHARYLDQLVAEGLLDRNLEFLPTDKQIAERQAAGSGLRTPEFAVMIAYTKNADIAEILGTDLPDDPALVEDLVGYFPRPLQDRFRAHILTHRLRREIATTRLVNQMVNVSGISYDHRMTEDTGAAVTDVARAWLATRSVLDFPAWWDEIDDLESLALDDHLELLLDCRRAVERCSSWFLRNRRPPLDIAAEAQRFSRPFREVAAGLRDCLAGPMRAMVDDLAELRVRQGVPAGLADRSSVWRLLHTVFDVIEAAARTASPPLEVAQAYWSVFDRLELMWLWDSIASLPRTDRWQTQARSALRHELLGVVAALAENVVRTGTVDAWWSGNLRSIERAVAMLTEIRRSDAQDLTTTTVAVRQLRNLALTS